MKYLIVLCLAVNFVAVNCQTNCTCPSNCNCTAVKATCEGIASMPTCLPAGVAELQISNSPDLTDIDEIPLQLVTLSVQNSGLQDLDKEAVSSATNLENLGITGCKELKSVNLGDPDGYHPLRNLSFANCTSLNSISNLNEYTSLVNIGLSYCDLESIDDDFFEDLENVKWLDLSHNRRLDDIDEDAFEDLISLETLYLNDCNLDTLHPEYFDTAYDNNLKYVNTLLNPFRCYKMCDFHRWLNDHEDFVSMSNLGTCTNSYYSTTVVYSIYLLDRYEAGCPTALGIILGATLGACLAVCIIAFFVVICCGIDYKKYCCCCLKSQRSRRSTESSASPAAHQAFDTHEYEAVSHQAPEEKTSINTPYPLPSYDAAPPSYAEVSKPQATTVQMPTP